MTFQLKHNQILSNRYLRRGWNCENCAYKAKISCQAQVSPSGQFGPVFFFVVFFLHDHSGRQVVLLWKQEIWTIPSNNTHFPSLYHAKYYTWYEQVHCMQQWIPAASFCRPSYLFSIFYPLWLLNNVLQYKSTFSHAMWIYKCNLPLIRTIYFIDPKGKIV